MDRILKKSDDKKTERITRDRGDIRKIVHEKVFQEVSAKEVTPTRECGDSKPIPVKPLRIETPQRLLNPKLTKNNLERKKAIETVAKRENKRLTDDNEDAKRREHNTKAEAKKDDMKKVEEGKPKPLPPERKARKVTDDNADRGDAKRTEQNVKVAKKEVEKEKSEDAKAKSILLFHGKDAKRSTDITEAHFTKPSKTFKADDKKHGEETKVKIPIVITPLKDAKMSHKSELQKRTPLDLDRRKLLRDRNTLKLKNKQNPNKNNDVKVNNVRTDERDTKTATDENPEKNKKNESKDPEQIETKSVKKPKQQVHRKPMIQTIRLNKDNRVYKAVTFIDEKASTPLQIKIPSHYRKEQKICESHLHSKAAESKVSVQINSLKRKKEKSRLLKARARSPLMVINNRSPQTEVAKWAPTSVNHHTKRYYEAWVNNTLAAITNCEKQGEAIEKQTLIQTFKRALHERPATPDLVYEKLNDVRYTGKITIRR